MRRCLFIYNLEKKALPEVADTPVLSGKQKILLLLFPLYSCF